MNKMVRMAVLPPSIFGGADIEVDYQSYQGNQLDSTLTDCNRNIFMFDSTGIEYSF